MDPLSPDVAAALAVARRARLQGADIQSSSLPPSVLQALALVNRHRGHFDDGGTVSDNGSMAPDFSMDPDLPPPPSTPAGLDANQRWGNAIVQEGSNIANGIASAVTLPRDVMQGTVDPMSDQGIQRALNLATMLPAGGMPMAERGALGSAGGALTTPALQEALSPAVAAEPSLEDLFAAWGGASPTSSSKASIPPATTVELQQRIDSLNPNKLPMDQPSRLARAQDLGFDTSTPLYHGTPNQWEGTGFRDTDGLRAERATFLTPNPDVATAYSSQFHSTDGSILPVFARMQNPMVVDMGGAGHSGLDAAIEAARSAGHDALIAHNVSDISGYDYDEVPQTQVAVFDPRNIRSVHATFDPAMEQSSDLLSAGGLSALPQDDRQKRAHGGSVMPNGLTSDQKYQWFSKGGQVESRMDAVHRLMKEAGISSPAEFHISQVLRAVDTNNPEIIRATMADVARTHRPPRPVHPEDRSAIPASVRQALHATQGYAHGGAVTSGMTPSVAAALRIAQAYARGGSIAPGLPAAPFQPIAAPHTVMPRIAAGHVPRILPMARGHFADGGSTLPPHVLHALAIVQDHARGHYDDGGSIGGSAGPATDPNPVGQFGSASMGNMQLGGLQLGGGEGSTLASLTGDPSGGASASTIGGASASTTGGPIVTPGGIATLGGSTSGAPGGFTTDWQPNTLTPINNNGPLGFRRPQFAKGGSAMHPSVLRALALVNQPRGHFDDGGNAGGGGDGNGGDGSGNSGGDSSGSGDSSSSSDRSGGGFSSGASSGADSSSPSSSGGGFSSGASSGADSSNSSEGNGGIGGAVSSAAASDAGASASTPASAPASNPYGAGPSAMTGSVTSSPNVGSFGSIGADGQVGGSMAASAPGGFAPGNVTGANMGFGVTDGFSAPSPAAVANSVTSNPYGSMPSSMTGATSNMAPSATDNIAGSMQSPAPGSFGSVGLQNATPTASNFTGFSTGDLSANPTNQGLATNPFGSLQQHAVADPGEDGTTGMGPADATAGGFSPYGGMPASMTGVTSDTAMASSNVGTFGDIGVGPLSSPIGASPLSNPGVMGALAASAPAGFNTGLGAYGLSTDNLPGFDNFNANNNIGSFNDKGAGDVASSSLGPSGYTGGFGDGVQGDMNGALAGPYGYVGTQQGLGTAPAATEDASAPAPTDGFTPDPVTVQKFNDLQQNGLPLGGPGSFGGSGTGTGLGAVSNDTAAPLGGAPVGDTGVGATTDPSSVDGTHALTVHGFSPLGPDAPADATTTTPSQAASAVPGMPAGTFSYGLHQIEGGVLNGQVDPQNPGHYGPAQFSQATFSDTARAHPELGVSPNMSMFGATPDQYSAMTNAHIQDIQNALTAQGYDPLPANTYMGWNLGITGALNALKAGPAANLTQAGITQSVQTSNPSIYGGARTVGDVQASLAAKFGNVSMPSGAVTQNAAPPGPAPNTFGAQGFNFSNASAGLANDPALSGFTDPAPAAPAPSPVTAMQPTPYSASDTDADTLTGNGYAVSQVNSFAIGTFGPAVGMGIVQSLNMPDSAPIGEAVPASVMAARPDIFAGVQTVGDMRANLEKAAQVGGPQVAVTSTAPATTSAVSPGVSAALTGIGAFTGDEKYGDANLGGAPQSTGLGILGGMAPTTTNNLGGLGMVGYDGTDAGQVAQNMAGWSQDGTVSSLPTMARMAVTAPGFEASQGFGATQTSPAASTATPGRSAVTSDATTDTTTPAKTLSVSPKIGNLAANVAMGAFGPLGMIGAGANTLSGFFGGPTIADGINNVLSHPGAPTSVTGTGDNAPGGGSASQSYYQNMMSTSPAASSSSSSSSAAPAPASNDPYSDAMAAYLATMAADGTQSSSGTTSSSTLGVTNALQNNRISRAPLQPIYRPLEDPTVLRALGLVA